MSTPKSEQQTDEHVSKRVEPSDAGSAPLPDESSDSVGVPGSGADDGPPETGAAAPEPEADGASETEAASATEATSKTEATSTTEAASTNATPDDSRRRHVAPIEDDASDTYRVSLPDFEGPLDLLLHLIQQHEVDILDIPVGFITERYLAYLNLMQHLTIDVASEYLVMAATLTLIKSKMLLPPVPGDEDSDAIAGEEADPRSELVKRLLEYQKYKSAAEQIGAFSALGRDVFTRGVPEEVPEGPSPFAPTGVFNLLDAFERVLKRSKTKLDHQVVFDRIGINDRILSLTEQLRGRRRTEFDELFTEAKNTFDIVITFLAILEMCKLRMLRVYQSEALAMIHVELAIEDDDYTPEQIYTDGALPKRPEEPARYLSADRAAEDTTALDSALVDTSEVEEGESSDALDLGSDAGSDEGSSEEPLDASSDPLDLHDNNPLVDSSETHEPEPSTAPDHDE